MNPIFWRKWHRWIAFPATLFLLFAAVTGVLVAWSEFFGAEEELREATRKLASPVTLAGSTREWLGRVARAWDTVAAHAGPDSRVDQVLIQFKGPDPSITIYTGKASGGEDRRFIVAATTGTLRQSSSYADKPFLHRLHSGEAFGDGGLVLAMFWGVSLAVLTASGLLIYLTMWRPSLRGWRRIFW